MKLDIIDESEYRAAAFGVKILASLTDNPGAREACDRGAQRRPRTARGHVKRECRNAVRRIAGVA
jgi:hypothetical protein